MANVPNNIELNDLTFNTKFYYRLRFKSNSVSIFSASPEYYFQTQRDKGSVFSFTVESDEHLYDKKGVRNMYQNKQNYDEQILKNMIYMIKQHH